MCKEKKSAREMVQPFVTIITVTLSIFMFCMHVCIPQSAWCLQRPDDDVEFCGAGVRHL